MHRLKLLDAKKFLIIVHDLAMTAFATLLVLIFRFDGPELAERVDQLPVVLSILLPCALTFYAAFDLYRSKWRFASLPDLRNIVCAVTLLTGVLFLLDRVFNLIGSGGTVYFGGLSLALYWFVQASLLGGPRLAYRYLKYAQARRSMSRDATTDILILGRAKDAEIVVRAIESGILKHLAPSAILSPFEEDVGQLIRSVPIVGTLDQLEAAILDAAERGDAIRRLVATPSALADDVDADAWLRTAARLGIPLSRFQEGGGDAAVALRPLEIEDLLLRPVVGIDRDLLGRFLAGRRIAVTGGGGSIGSEICRRCLAFGAREVLVVEHSEAALHGILEDRAEAVERGQLRGVIADVRDAARLARVFDAFRPELVIHAAALKQVPYIEEFWSEGIETNIFGSVNVVDAAVEAGARGVIIVSTDKAIAPVSLLGATKRFSEIYAQAKERAQQPAGPPTRLIAVRFGNVLGSVGSVVPRFKAQIARGGPVTVTHAGMIRYFMTIREACDLVLTAASHGIAPSDAKAPRPSVYVLQMGQPVAIVELAERMIRLAGREPGRDIEIVFTGPRSGERLEEILFDKDEPIIETGVPGIIAASTPDVTPEKLAGWLARLRAAIAADDRAAAERVLEEAIPNYRNSFFKQPSESAPLIP